MVLWNEMRTVVNTGVNKCGKFSHFLFCVDIYYKQYYYMFIDYINKENKYERTG